MNKKDWLDVIFYAVISVLFPPLLLYMCYVWGIKKDKEIERL